MTSIKDVARSAGVAISTVSKVLNGYPGVSEETRQKVNEAIEKLHFMPNAAAATLSSEKTGRVALLLNLADKNLDEINMQYISGAIHKALELKMDAITLFFSMLEGKSAREIISYLRAQSIEALIIYGMSREDEWLAQIIRSGLFKIVVVDGPFCDENTSSVWIDQKKAQYEVAKKTLLENPHCRRICYIAGKRNGFITQGRIDGMQLLAQEMGLELIVEYGEFSERQARALAFSHEKDADMFVCASDLMAIGVMRALTELDVFRPVCGFDGITLMGYAGQQMNTVRQNFYGISAAAVEEVQRLFEGEQGRNLVLEHEVIQIQYQDIIG